MDVTILGCRGSIPTAYPDIMRYGGDTTCLEIRADDTVILLDAGTGIRKHQYVPESVKEVHLFITHLHWDHIIGFPHWSLLKNRSDVVLNIYALERSHDNFYRALERSMSEPLYAHDVKELPIEFRYHGLRPGYRVDLGNVSVTCALANHPYRALGYRVEHDGQALAFVPDTAPFDRFLFAENMVTLDTSLTPIERDILIDMEDELIHMMGDADWLIYDAAVTPTEYAMLPHWGHSTMDQAVQMAEASGARELIFFHHDPRRTDDQIDAMLDEQRARNPHLNLQAAYSGMRLGGLR